MLGLVGCTANKYLAEGDKFYAGADIKIKPGKHLEDEAKVRQELQRLLHPEPNSKLLGSRPRVWFYQLAGDVKKEKGFKHWMKNKLGRKPVLINDVDVERIRKQIETTLQNNGYFNARVTSQLKTSKHKESVVYQAKITAPYHYDTIIYNVEDTALQTAIESIKNEKLIQEGDRYSLSNLSNKRTRIESQLKNRGYYNFDDQYLLFRADSTMGDKKVKMFLTLKSSTPEQARKTYPIRQVKVTFDNTSMALKRQNFDTIKTQKQVKGIQYYDSANQFRPEIIADNIAIKPGKVYSKENELITLNRLIQLDVFKFVNIDYQNTKSGDSLNASIFLSPYKKKSLRLELQAVSKSNNFVGPNFTATFKNRNIFRGAESYELSLDAGYEVQVGGSKNNQALNSYTLGLENILTVPRILSPFNIRNNSTRFVPQTKFKLGFRTLKRINFFTLNSIDAGYGFHWRETKTKRHELYPVDVSFIQLGKTSAAFDSVLTVNPLLQRSYEEQFILGTTYSYYYNSQNDQDRESLSDFYFNGNIDLSGNLMHLAQSSLNATESEKTNSYQILGSSYSQFVKSDIDLRYYLHLSDKHTIATRLITGVGYAFGNSYTLPYTKQFSIGGSNSVRAFRARSVGPGRYQLPDSVTFVDQTADIKLEGNFEYRFPIIGAFKGAMFVDAGNIWTIRYDEQRQGSQFDKDRFLSEIAIGTGLGLRFDADFFVLRLDLAFPLRVPYRPRGDRWLIDQIAVDKSSWRRDNLVLNIAIGYPF